MATFSITDRQTYKRCRRKWNYSSNARMNLERVGSGAEALELGGLVHRALAQWVLEPQVDLPVLFMKHAADRMVEISKKYEENVGAKISDEELAPLLDVVQLGEAMMKNYQAKYKTPIPKNMKFASVEQEIIVDVPGTEHSCENCIRLMDEYVERHSIDVARLIANVECKECGGTGIVRHKVSATLDGMLQDLKDRLYVLEHKTFSPRYRPTIAKLNREDQFTGYAWIITQLDIGNVVGIAYNGMSKQEKPTRGKTFDDMFLRVEIPKTPEQLEAWGKNLVKEISEMADEPYIYPNIPWNGCEGDCSFIDLCDAELNGSPIDRLIQLSYVQRETVRVQGIRS